MQNNVLWPNESIPDINKVKSYLVPRYLKTNQHIPKSISIIHKLEKKLQAKLINSELNENQNKIYQYLLNGAEQCLEEKL